MVLRCGLLLGSAAETQRHAGLQDAGEPGGAGVGWQVNDCFTKFGEELFAYVGPGPPKGTGWHRYAVLLWNQHGPRSWWGSVRGSRYGLGVGDTVRVQAPFWAGHISFDEVEHPRHDHTGTSATARCVPPTAHM